MSYRLIIILFCLSFFGCGDSLPVYNPPMPNYWGYVKGSINGNSWNPKPYIPFRDSTVTIAMETLYNYGELHEELYISNVPTLPGLYRITSSDLLPGKEIGAFFGVTTGDGDVFGDAFVHNDAFDDSFIEIISWDPDLHAIKGTFTFRLLRSVYDMQNSSNPEYPDTLKFVGEFLTKYLE